VLYLDLPSFPVLATPRLRLRALSTADAPALFRLRSDPRVMHHIPKPLFFKSDEAVGLLRDFQRAYEAREAIMWAIAVKGSAEACGIVGYWRIMAEHHRAEIGYFLDPDLWGQGLMTEAVKAVLDFGFGAMGLHSVEAATHPANASSMHVLEQNGFVREGYFKENIRANGEFVDSVVYSRLASPKGGPFGG
jgi:ribosomal-protein-alanine N-acetyltransferase